MLEGPVRECQVRRSWGYLEKNERASTTSLWRGSLWAASMLFTPMQVEQRCLKTLMAPKESTGSGLLIWRQLLEKGFQQRTCSQLPVREEDAVSNISSRDISDEELGLEFTEIITVVSSFRGTIDNGHLCSHRLLYRSFLSLHENTDEYQYYSPLGGKWHWMVARLPEGETVELN